MTVNDLFGRSLDIFSFFIALMINLTVLYVFSQTLKNISEKGINKEMTTCFQCEIVNEIKQEEPLVNLTETISTKNETIKDEIKEKEVSYNSEPKKEVIEKKELKKAKPKIVHTEKKVTQKNNSVDMHSLSKENLTNNLTEHLKFNNPEVYSNEGYGQVNGQGGVPQNNDYDLGSSHSNSKNRYKSEGFSNSDIKVDKKSEVITKILNLIEKEKYYPHLARKAGITGIVKINITIDKSGKIIEYSLINNDANKILAEAALETIKRVTKNYTLSTNLEENISLIIPIRYELIN